MSQNMQFIAISFKIIKIFLISYILSHFPSLTPQTAQFLHIFAKKHQEIREKRQQYHELRKLREKTYKNSLFSRLFARFTFFPVQKREIVRRVHGAGRQKPRILRKTDPFHHNIVRFRAGFHVIMPKSGNF